MNPDFNDDHTPLGYLLTFRSYGTWLHGDKRGSVDRCQKRYGSPMLPPSERRNQIERRLLKQRPREIRGATKRRNRISRTRDLHDSQVGFVGPERSQQSRSLCDYCES